MKSDENCASPALENTNEVDANKLSLKQMQSKQEEESEEDFFVSESLICFVCTPVLTFINLLRLYLFLEEKNV